jgi:uncharacterized membrane protein YkvA (DUF1232 family)
MSRVRSRDTDVAELARCARHLLHEVGSATVSDFVLRQLRRLGPMMRMIDDPATPLDAAARTRVLDALAYVAEPHDLIPDATPEIGLLDDAIVVGFVANELQTEIEAFEARELAAMYARMARHREPRTRRGALIALR